MGWRLAVEVLEHCPDVKYRQFRVLMAWALDANDDTRQGMPGAERLTERANCKLRQAMEAMSGLRELGILKVVRKSAPGVRAVYEMPPMCTDNGCEHSRTRSTGNACGDSRMRTHADFESTHADFESTHAGMSAHTQSLISSHKAKSSLSRAIAQIQAAVPGATEREISYLVDELKINPKVQSVGAYLTAVVTNGDAADLVADTRKRMRRGYQRTEDPPKCGRCDQSRHIVVDGGRVARCPDCHPLERIRRENDERNRQLDALDERASPA